MKTSLLSPLAATALVGVLSILIALGASSGPQGLLTAAASSGSIDFAKIDADPGAPGIQPCRSVGPGETFSIDLIVGSIDAADSDNFASGGNIGFNFNTGDFTSPDIDFEPGALDDIGDLTSFPLGTSDEKAAGKTHVARAYLTSPNVSAPDLVGSVAVARATLTAGTETGVKPIRITKSTPLDGSFDFFMGASPTVQPTNMQPATIAVGVDCPSDGASDSAPPDSPPDSAPPDSAPDSAPSGGTPVPGGPQTITLSTAAPEGDCPSTFTIVEGPSNGTLGEISSVSCSEGIATATVLYTPDDGFSGNDSFTFKVADGDGDAESVTVNVLPVDATPAAAADTDTEETAGPGAASQASDDGDTNWTLIAIIAVAAAAAAAALAAGAWWRLRRPGRPRES